MEASRSAFSLSVGAGFVVFGSIVASKASIGLSLIFIGMALIAITLISGKWAETQRTGSAMLSTSVNSTNHVASAQKNQSLGNH